MTLAFWASVSAASGFASSIDSKMESVACTAAASSSSPSSSFSMCAMSSIGASCSIRHSRRAALSSGCASSASASSWKRSTTSIEMSEFSCVRRPSREVMHRVLMNERNSSGAVASRCNRFSSWKSSSSDSMNFSGLSGYFMRICIFSLIFFSTLRTIRFIAFSSSDFSTSTFDSSRSRSASASSSAAAFCSTRCRFAGGIATADALPTRRRAS
mmetsp:Transcript_37374/g.87411  ORF Transcript_37374/g.87411 Transcript_37374/m.87411 type:complete len:214 (-) Transcript_37374:91-732(-)